MTETPRDPLADYYQQFQRKVPAPPPATLAVRLGRFLGVLIAGLGSLVSNVVVNMLTWGIYCGVFGSIAWVWLVVAEHPQPYWHLFAAAGLLRSFVLAVKNAWAFNTKTETDLSK